MSAYTPLLNCRHHSFIIDPRFHDDNTLNCMCAFVDDEQDSITSIPVHKRSSIGIYPKKNVDEIEALLLLSSDSAERSTPASLSKIVSLLGFHENLVSHFLPEGPSLEIWKNPQNESIVVHVDGSTMIQLGRVGVASAPSSFPNSAKGG